jgi:hypothetical protein
MRSYVMLDFNGAPAVVGTGFTQEQLEIEHLDTRAVLATFAPPVADHPLVHLSHVLELPTGTALVFSTRTSLEDEEATYWLVRFDTAGAPSYTKLIQASIWAGISVAVVGDRVVVASMDQSASRVVILDSAGTKLHELDEPAVKHVFGIDDTRFAIEAEVQGGLSAYRVFDAKQLAWVSESVSAEQRVLDAVTLGNRVVLVGAAPSDDPTIPESGPLLLAALDATGTLTPWQPMNTDAVGAGFLRSPRNDGAWLVLDDANGYRLAAVDSDLHTLVGSPLTAPPDDTYPARAVAVPGSLYVYVHKSMQRYDCNR